MTRYMGYTKSWGKRHIVDVPSGYERTALCGVKVEHWVINFKTNKPIPFAERWRNGYCGVDDVEGCEHCEMRLKIEERPADWKRTRRGYRIKNRKVQSNT